MPLKCHAYAKMHMRRTQEWADAINARERAKRRVLAVARVHDPESKTRKKAERTYWTAQMRSENAYQAAVKVERALHACQRQNQLSGALPRRRKRRR